MGSRLGLGLSGQLGQAKQFINACLCPCLGIDAFYDDGAGKAIAAIGRGQAARNNDTSFRNTPIEDLSGFAIVDFGSLANEHTH